MARILIVSGLAIAWAPRASALDPERRLTQYMQDVWTHRVEIPWGTITGIAQAQDGYLWLATDSEGLYRFDGVRFVRDTEFDRLFGRRGYRVNALLAGADGVLWAGTQFGVGRRVDGRWKVYGERYDAVDLAFAANGDLLMAARDNGLIRWHEGRAEQTPIPGDCVRLAVAGNGDIWAAGRMGLFRVQGREVSRLAVPGRLGGLTTISALCMGRGGSLWVATRGGLHRVAGGRVAESYTRSRGLPSDEVTAVLEDREGSVWVGTGALGLARLRPGGRAVETFDKSQGLPSPSVTTFYEDQEGSLWIATRAGLSRLKVGHFTPYGKSEGLANDHTVSIIEGRDGSLWIWSDGGGLSHIKNGAVRVFTTRDGLASDFGGPLYEARDGSIWIGHDRGVSRVKDGRVTAFREGPLGRDYVPFFAEEGSDLLTFVFGMGLVILRDGRVTPYRPVQFLPGDDTTLERFPMPFSARRTRDGTLWLGTAKGAWTLRDGILKKVWALSADRMPMVNWVHETEDGTVWLATWDGLYRLKGGVSAAVSEEQGLPHRRIAHILEDRLGYFWLGSPTGIARVKRADLDAAADGRAPRITPEIFGMADGLRSPEALAAAQPAGCAARDGRLWFVTGAGAVVVDPEHLKRNTLAPLVAIEDVVTDGRARGASPQLSVEAGTNRIEIQYTALSLFAPEKVQFKYRLEGFEGEWVEAGGRRVAYYTRVPPGSYRFRVIAANNDGVWNEGGASLVLEQRPHFYQTGWFYGAFALSLAGAALGAHQLRVRRHVRAQQELQARVDEALAHIKTLRGLMPICAWCKKVRDDSGYWSQIEVYLKEHTEAEFSHGICPECRAKTFRRGARPGASGAPGPGNQ